MSPAISSRDSLSAQAALLAFIFVGLLNHKAAGGSRFRFAVASSDGVSSIRGAEKKWIL